MVRAREEASRRGIKVQFVSCPVGVRGVIRLAKLEDFLMQDPYGD